MASYESLLVTLEDLGNKELKKFQWFLHQASIKEGCPAIPKSRLEDTDRQDTVDEMVKTYGHRRAVELTVEVLRKINRNDLVEFLLNIDLESIDSLLPKPEPPALTTLNQNSLVPTSESPVVIDAYHCKLQSNLQNKYMCVPEGCSMQKGKKHLGDIYTDVYLTEGHLIDINRQHEVRQIEAALRKPPVMEKPLQPNEMFKPSSGTYAPMRTVLTNGIAGIGKTFLVHKFILDWANGTANQDVLFLFPFTFRQLNLLKGKQICLTKLIHTCIRETIDIKEEDLNSIFTALQTSGNSNYDKSEFKILFVLDGLDESRLQLDFTSDDELSVDIRAANTVDALLTNLIKGILLPSVRIWITTRPAAAKQIPSKYVDVFTEVRGFTDRQKEEYFRKRFKDETLASRIISHIKTSRSVHIMCHIPVFCSITATVLEHVYTTEAGEGSLPKTLTEMYTRFLVFQIKQTTLKYGSEKSIKCIQSLAKLAFHQLQKGNLIFYENDLKKSGVHYNEVSVYSGVFTQIFKSEYGLREDNVFSFIHLSIQEFLAALYVVLSLINNNKNVVNEEQQQSFPGLRDIFRKVTATEVLMNAVDKAIQSANGQLDLLLRFLLGLSMETNQILLLGLLKQTGSSSQTNQEIARYIKKRIRENLCPERILNLFHCLNELNDHSLVEEIQRYLTSGTLGTIKPSATEWSALTFVLLTSEENLDVFDLGKYCRSEDSVLVRMLPLVNASTTTLLRQCELSSQCCGVLASVLQSTTQLKELDLTANDLQDTGVKLLAAGLESPCRLETLRLSGCKITEEGCASLALALRSNPFHLRNLDLSHNNLLDIGVKQLLPGLQNLNTLQLKRCGLGETCCQYLASVLSSNLSSLRELDLCDNDLQNIGVKWLSTGLESKHCRLEILRLSGCMITEAGCASLSFALKSNPSYLRALDLSYNHPGSSGGVTLLSAGLEDPNWKLEILNVDHGGEIRIQPGPRKYVCELTLDPNTAERHLLLSEGYRKVTRMNEEQPYPDHPERFERWDQVLCSQGLTGRCYWEVECKGVVGVGVAYRGIGRKERDNLCRLGRNDKSWSLYCNRSISWHDGKAIVTSGLASQYVGKAGVHVDWPTGTVSFYNASSNTPIHIHTFHTTFSEPLYPGCMVVGNGSSAFLCL